MNDELVTEQIARHRALRLELDWDELDPVTKRTWLKQASVEMGHVREAMEEVARAGAETDHTPAETPDMTEYRDRLHRAESALLALTHTTNEVSASPERTRLRGKLEGVRLALDYLREMT